MNPPPGPEQTATAGKAAELLVVLTNVPDAQVARAIAEALVAERLAACVNILAPCRSIYRWEGAIEHAEEVPLLIKTAHAGYAALERRLKELHPYEVPEILAWPPQAGWPAYLEWVLAQARPSER